MGWFTTTDEAIAALGSSKDSKRLWGLRILQEKAADADRNRRIGQHDVAVKQVVHLLSDANPEIQASAADTILVLVDGDCSNQERIGADQGAVEGLVALLSSSDARVQLSAPRALWHLAAGHPGSMARYRAAAEGAVGRLMALLGSNVTDVQEAAGVALVLLTNRHVASCVTVASHPGALPELARLLNCSDQSGLQVVIAAFIANMCAGCPEYAQQLAEQFPEAVQQLVELAVAQAQPDKGQCAAAAILSIAASCASGRQLLVKQPAVLGPLVHMLHQETWDSGGWRVEDVREIVEILLEVVKAEAGMQMVVGGNTQLVAALSALQATSSDAATRDGAGEVLGLVGTKAPGHGWSGRDSSSCMQTDITPLHKDQQSSSKPAATTSDSSRFNWEPPAQSEAPRAFRAVAPLAAAMGLAAGAVRAVPVHGALIGAVVGAAQTLLQMVDQVRINKAKVRSLGGRVKGLLQYLEALEPSWPQVEAALTQKQWQVLEAQLGALEAALGRARTLVEGYVQPMLLQRALRFLTSKLDFDDLSGVDSAVSTAMATLTNTTTSLNLVITVQRAQVEEVVLIQAHDEDVLQLQQDLSLLVGGQQALEQQLGQASQEVRQQWQEATTLLAGLAAALQGIESGVVQLQGGMGRLEVGVVELSSDMQAVMAGVQELMALVKAPVGKAAGASSAGSSRRPVSSQLVLDREQVVWDSSKDHLDSGGFGSVYAGTYHGAPVAVKQLDLADLDTVDKNQVFYEAAVLSRLHHPCIVQFFGVVVEQVRPSGLSRQLQPRLSLVMERCDTNLAVTMREEPLLPLPKALHIAGCIAAALTYLHHTSKVKVVHGDLKPANVLLTEAGRVKLTDFGLSQTIAVNSSALMNKGVTGRGNSSSGGTLLWTPPEVLEAWVAGNDLEAAPAHDIYALGVLLYQLLTGRAPYKQYKREEPFKAAVRAGERPLWGDWQQERAGQAATEVLVALQQLAEDCWAQEPGTRPTAQQVQKRLEELRAQLA